MIRKRAAFTALAAIAASGSAHAAVTISTAATQNMTCSGGVCAPTATDAVLSVTDLENLLSSGDVSVITTNGSVQANDIDVNAAFSWSAANSLTLDAYQSITFSAVVQNQSVGKVSLITNDGGSGGALTFTIGIGRLDTNTVSVDGESYHVASNIKSLASAVFAKPSGRFALAHNIDAASDGIYYDSPIPVPFGGKFNGLGHRIANLEVAGPGLFANVKNKGSVASLSLKEAVVRGGSVAGALVGYNHGVVSNAFASGRVHAGTAGGLIGENVGIVSTSQSAVLVSGSGYGGGLVGDNMGTIALSFATGKISASGPGGLVGINHSVVANSYATGDAAAHRSDTRVGGFVAVNWVGSISASYSTGAVSDTKHTTTIGGFDGTNQADSIANSYWDTETSGQDQGSGDGNNTGLTGLTTQQFQSGLPAGFDPAIWAEDANINNGLPYLINNPPSK